MNIKETAEKYKDYATNGVPALPSNEAEEVQAMARALLEEAHTDASFHEGDAVDTIAGEDSDIDVHSLGEDTITGLAAAGLVDAADGELPSAVVDPESTVEGAE